VALAGTTQLVPVRAVNGAGEPLVGLMQRVAARDRAAFATLYAATSAKLYGVILRILRRRDVADEVLQEVYVQVWERAGQYDAAKASPVTWMATMARNRALDEVRRKRPTPMGDARELVEGVSEEDDPLEQLEQSERLARLRQCLDRLDEERRQVVLLAYREGMSREALAERFACPTGTVKSWLRRSLLQLRECLEQ
jgi:RNA polymerase sigma-70 factor (ECF subfamily)